MVTATVQKYNFVEMRSVYLGLCLAFNFIWMIIPSEIFMILVGANHLTVFFNRHISDTIDVIDHDAIAACGQY